MNKSNLLRVVKFLRELKPEKFNFGTLRHHSGKCACAIGWTPEIFPELNIEIKTNLSSKWLVSNITFNEEKITYLQLACRLFEISQKEAQFLFTPSTLTYTWEKQYEGNFISQALQFDASANRVASHIEEFIVRKEEGWILS